MEIVKKFVVNTLDDVEAVYKKHGITLENSEIVSVISSEYEISQAMADKIYTYAYAEYHSGGISEIINALYDLIDLVKDCIDIERGEHNGTNR